MKKLSQKKLQFYKIMVSVLFFTFSSLSAGIVYIPPGPDAEAKYLKRIKTRYLEIERADAGLAELPSTPGRFTQLLDQFQAYLPYGKQVIGGTRSFFHYYYSSVKDFFFPKFLEKYSKKNRPHRRSPFVAYDE
jgi:hypothetical protein